MKKNTLIFVTALTTVILIAFGFNQQDDAVKHKVKTSGSKLIASDNQIMKDFNFDIFPDFFYKVDTRFQGVKKEKLDDAISVIDFLPKEHAQSIVSYKSVSVIILDDYKQTDIKETGTSELLTAAQTKLLRSADYSTNILIKVDYQRQNKDTGQSWDTYFTPYLTIVPEKHAAYESGKNALIKYIKENSRAEKAIIENNKLRPGRLFFTVTKNGKISNVKLAAKSGYPSIDKKMIKLIYEAPEKWNPAENSKGEKVDQELVLFFGTLGC